MDILTVKNLKKYFPVKTGLLNKKVQLNAVDGVNFSIEKNKTFALVGESGCGKSTVARLLLRLLLPTSGEVIYKGKNIFGIKGDDLKSYRRSVQIIFQDPFASLNPRMRISDILSEPFKIHKIIPKEHYGEKVADILNKVGLDTDVINRYPHEFSGGQRQRICIARALMLSPEMIVADEPLSSLDVSIQAQILNILKDLQLDRGISFLFISHDLNVLKYFSDYIAVMYLGRIVEQTDTEELFKQPMHPYTEMLIESIPKINVGNINKVHKDNRTTTVPLIDVPSPIDIPEGCPFHPRCPKRFDICNKIFPELKRTNGRLISCHLYNP